MPASPSPLLVPAPYSNPCSVDPEEAFVAAVSSCHMLTFLYLAARRGLAVSRYTDEAVGTMVLNDAGVPWVGTITLNVLVQYSGQGTPSQEDEDHLHHEAHEQCFIANSIKSEVLVRCRSSGT